ncbi:MAG: putative bifunctional diguanylate cyclase/phosphodiesterase [Alkalispirochaetaceae bacterium]
MGTLDSYLHHPAFPEDLKSTLELLNSIEQLPIEAEQGLVRLADRIASQRDDLAHALHQLHELAEESRQKRVREQKLEKQLTYDEMTGLPNHRAMEQELPQLLEQMRERRIELPGADLLIINVEDSYLHLRRTLPKQITEWLIYSTAERLQLACRKDERLYHVREAEFLFLLRRGRGGDQDQRVQDIIDSVGSTFQFPDYTVTLQVRCGVAAFPQDGVDRYRLTRKADIALGVARTRKAQFIRFDESMERSLIEKMDLQNHIIRALERQAIEAIDEQFELQLQPIVSIEASTPGSCTYRLIGAEALIRWNHPKHGRVEPSRFIPVAEESGLIIPIGNWVLFHAAEILNRWNKPPLNELSLSVNISPRQFRDENLLDNLRRIVGKNRFARNRLCLEITESTVMEQPDEAADKLAEISKMGILVAIDDFGTGYSSLSFLRRFGFHNLKLDKSFIDDFLDNLSSRRIVTAVVEMARAIGVSVIAEGVESSTQAVALASTGVRHIQGYVMGVPQDIDEFVAGVGGFSGRIEVETGSS